MAPLLHRAAIIMVYMKKSQCRPINKHIPACFQYLVLYFSHCYIHLFDNFWPKCY